MGVRVEMLLGQGGGGEGQDWVVLLILETESYYKRIIFILDTLFPMTVTILQCWVMEETAFSLQTHCHA